MADMPEKKKKVLCVLAHPDDEVIFGWPFLQDETFDKELLLCVSDRHNKEKKWCAHRRDALAALCHHLGLRYTCLEHSSGFYRSFDRKKKQRGLKKLFPRPKQPLIRDIAASILEAVAASECDYIFTHNFWGEYGHLDHILVNTLVFNNCAKPLFITDARLQLYWMPLKPAAPAMEGLLQPHFHSSCVMDKDFYEQCAAFYKTTGTWTWAEPPVERVNLYKFSGEVAAGA